PDAALPRAAGGGELVPAKAVGAVSRAASEATPRNRRDSHHTGRVVAIGRLASVAGDRQAGHADSLASNGVSVVLAVAITGTGTSTHSSRPAAADRADGDGESDLGRGADRGGAQREARDSGVAANGSTIYAAARLRVRGTGRRPGAPLCGITPGPFWRAI